MPISVPGTRSRSDGRRLAHRPALPTQWRRHGRPGSGFTLIELVVVLFILAIILGLAGVRLTRDAGDIVRDEARRLVLLLQNAQQQAILEGRPYGFVVTGDGYRFLQLDEQYRLVPVRGDELLSERVLPPVVALATVGLGAEAPTDPETGERRDMVLFDPSGEFTAFTFSLESQGVVWYVRGQIDGQILSTPFLETAT